MPPEERFLPRFAAEPPQEALPYGRWATTLGGYFLAVFAEITPDDGVELGTPGEISWFPDRSYGGRTYVPAVARTTTGLEAFGFVAFSEGSSEPSDFSARADYTSEVAEDNPDWKLDLNDDVVATWRGEQGKSADMTLVWGTPMIAGGAIVTAELAGLVVDQCDLVEERFTLLAPDNYRGDYLDVKLWDRRSNELAAESLYVDEDEEDEDEEEAEDAAGAE